ncbi:MAG: type 1 glutamine amidotransferase domain-containing protein [Pseudobacteriovorax sp.]|nr:type 1 glutamine amidotransferase domain-containing protein [Pseudobacteriovorax sp.]
MAKVKEVVGAVHHGQDNSKGKILMIVANPSVSKQTGWPIGIWAAELTHPYYEFISEGYSVELASPNGGKIEFDGYSDPRHESGYSKSDFLSMGFINTPSLMALLKNTKKLSKVNAKEYAAIFLVGGQSPMYTFRGNKGLMKFVADFYESGKPTALVCHSTAVLLDTKLSSGRLLVKGKTWTGFADSEEKYADKAVGQKIQPFWIETEARKIKGTKFKVKAPFTPYAIKDGNLITGQQQASGAAAAKLVLQSLK